MVLNEAQPSADIENIVSTQREYFAGVETLSDKNILWAISLDRVVLSLLQKGGYYDV